MAFVITDACRSLKVAACIGVCPMDCIHPTPAEAKFASVDQLYINPDECIDCRLCAAECPVSAIFHEDEVPAGQEETIQRNRTWFRDSV